MNILTIKKILIILFSALSIGAVQANETIIKIGLLLVSPPWNTSQFLQQSIHYLSWKLPQYKFEAVWVSVDDIEKPFEEGKLNLAVFPSLPTLFGNSKTRRVLSTIVDTRAPNPDSGTSCVILVPKDSPIKDLKDIQRKHIISPNKMSLPGNLACLAEIEKSGINTDELNLRLLGDLNEKFLIDDLKQHKADAAFVRSGFIEDVLLASGKNILEGLRVLNPQQNKQLLNLVHSTGTYPGPTLVANNNISPQAVHAILSTLLTIPQNSYGQKWTVPANSESVDELARNLKIGPYAYLRSWTVERIWEEYKFFVTLAVLFIIFLFIHSWLTQKEVVKKTAHLSQALKDQKAAEEMAAAKGKRIEFLEKKAVIGQLSNIVAHEVNGPIGIIQNLTHGLRKQIDVTLDSEADPTDVLDSIENQLNIIEKEADKVCSIIAKMRLANKTSKKF